MADLEREVNVTSFSHRIPAPAGLARIELEGPDGLLDALDLSAHPPDVAVTSPRSDRYAKPAGGSVRVAWDAMDGDGDALLSTVLYSTDGGRTYVGQSVEQAESSFDVALGKGPTHHVKVVVTDGGMSSEAVAVFTTETPADLVARLAAAYRRGTPQGCSTASTRRSSPATARPAAGHS